MCLISSASFSELHSNSVSLVINLLLTVEHTRHFNSYTSKDKQKKSICGKKNLFFEVVEE